MLLWRSHVPGGLSRRCAGPTGWSCCAPTTTTHSPLNLTAFINRLTALFRQTRFYDKALFALVVSGYSGSDLVARQLISAMNMNKSFYRQDALPCWETANDQGRPWAQGSGSVGPVRGPYAGSPGPAGLKRALLPR